jgi:lipopolysaccharide export system protein LptA
MSFNYNLHIHLQRATLVLLFVALGMCAWAQAPKKRVKLIHADEWSFDKEVIEAQRLKGNVQLEYEGSLFFCDSAYLYPNDDFDAFSRIRVQRGADYTLTSNKLHFDHARSTAVMTENITLRDREMSLTTNHLEYNTENQIANYTGGGKILSNKNNNVLTSERGTYNSKNTTFYFRNKVVLKNPDYTVTSDTLNYNNNSETAFFFGPTYIKGKEDKLYCENGWYDTKKDICQFRENAEVLSDKTRLRGDSIYYNGKKGIGEVFRNVFVQDTTTNFFITGEYGKHDKKLQRDFVTRNALMTQIDESQDTLYMAADTLLSIGDSLNKNGTIHAFHHVLLLRKDMQGKCDSLTYAQSDSLLRMFGSPVLWSDQNQITGDSIVVQSDTTGIQQMWVNGNCFVVSQADTARFNQIKGRKLTGYFSQNKLYRVYVEGNGQLIFFPTDDKKKTPVAMGLNEGECSNIDIQVENNELKKIRLEKETNSKFSPMNKTTEEQYLLKNFKWRGAERPKSVADLHKAHE